MFSIGDVSVPGLSPIRKSIDHEYTGMYLYFGNEGVEEKIAIRSWHRALGDRERNLKDSISSLMSSVIRLADCG